MSEPDAERTVILRLTPEEATRLFYALGRATAVEERPETKRAIFELAREVNRQRKEQRGD